MEQLLSPSDPDQQERQTWGAQFHLLVQQWQLRLPVERLAEGDPQLQRWFEAFVQAAPAILGFAPGETNPLHQSEHSRTLEFQNYLLTVVYDLLITEPHQARILDWKTYPRPRQPKWLRQNWQTRLYPFVLAETSDFEPEQISMTYWFFQTRPGESAEPQSYSFAYDRIQHEQTRSDLVHLLNQLDLWLHSYPSGEPLPQVPEAAAICPQCPFALGCGRESGTEEVGAEMADEQHLSPLETGFSLPDLAAIQEIPL
jgi:hypothetical protein